MMPRPTKTELEDARDQHLPDILEADLSVWFIGINPSLYSAAVGHHFARPGNRFWPALFDSGFTPRQLVPHEDRQLLAYGAGLTNLVTRATARAAELESDELREGGRTLMEKVAQLKPDCLAFVGITAYRSAFRRATAQIGRQSQRLADTLTWVLPNPSGLNAHYQRADFHRLFAELREATVAGDRD